MLPWLRVDILKRGQSPWGDTGVKWFPCGEGAVQRVNEDQDPGLQSAIISQCQTGYEDLRGYAFPSGKENSKHL